MIKGFLAGLVIANGFEWFAHNIILHGKHRVGKPRYSPVPKSMKSHWEHHREVRKQKYYDDGYEQGWANWRTRNEIISLSIVAVTATAVAYPFSKGVAAGFVYSACNYFYTHRRSHMQPEWGKKTIPWHYDHHMNANQDANWCVTKPWFDYIMGTRVVSSDDLKEQNPLGIALPQFVADGLNQFAHAYFPAKYVEKKSSENVIEMTSEVRLEKLAS
jgi:hypothetical protein